MANSIRVRVLNRDFSLLVKEKDEARTREMAAYVDDKIKEFRRAHPEQPEITAVIIAALAVAEDLFSERDERDHLEQLILADTRDMTATLNAALAVNGADRDRGE
jgi:cell division protein ZapA